MSAASRFSLARTLHPFTTYRCRMRVSYHPGYVVELPPGHAFPMRKFSELHAILLSQGVVRPHEVVAPHEAGWELLAHAHAREYLDALRDGTLSPQQVRRLGLPWSPALVRRSRLATQGTLNAARFALEDGVGGNLAGGTHHALWDGGEGYCVINDVGVTVRHLQSTGEAMRVLVVDLDVHHGNANAALFADDERVFTFSMHGARNFPLIKPPGSLDVPLEDGTGDEEYLRLLAEHLPRAIEAARADLAFLLAGVDVVAGDRFGRLALTEAGLAERDRLALSLLRGAGLPVTITLSGGYASSPHRTAQLHASVYRQAVRVG
jgi:acetoin utilization deacetylase AcuC-like enzyme